MKKTNGANGNGRRGGSEQDGTRGLYPDPLAGGTSFASARVTGSHLGTLAAEHSRAARGEALSGGTEDGSAP